MNKANSGGVSRAFQNGKAFIPFITGGDPDMQTTELLLPTMEQAGADLIEIGIPFSDPVAEGPVIQEANIRALAAGATTDKIFDVVKKVRPQMTIPIVFLTYINPIYTYGAERFMARCAECGVEGLIIPDMPHEERGELKEVCDKYRIEVIPLIAPTSKERILAIAKEAQGFVYVVSSMGVTGIREEIKTDIVSMVKLVREATNTPCAVGFGIATPEQAKEMAEISDGAIVGSAIVKMIEKDGKNAVEDISTYVRAMKEAVQQAEQ